MDTASERLESILLSLSDDLARAISARDAEGATRGVQEDEHVVYISNGKVIRGHEYRTVLSQFYSSMQKIDFRWERREIQKIDDTAGIVTGWAAISMVNSAGSVTTDKAMFTIVYKHNGDSYKMLTAHKTSVK